jgi:hypothetical protein
MAAFPELENPQMTSGGVPFEFLFENYSEDFIVRGTNSFMKARVAWEDAGDFLYDILGSTDGMISGSSYTRLLPLEHPGITDCWCVDAKLLSTPSSTKGGSNQYDEALDTGMFTCEWAVYGLTFSRLPYFVVSDADVASQTIKELFRYCVIAERPRAREFTVNSYGLVVEADPTIVLKTPAFIMDREQDIVITQYQTPAGLYPATAIENCLGRINQSVVELPVSYNGGSSYVTRTYPVHTLLFRGLATDITVYPGPVGDSGVLRWYRDIPMFFTYRPGGWRKLPDPTGTGDYIVVVKRGIAGDNKYLYTEQQFAAMFKPSV